jgi:hypothetical protein
MYMDVHCSSMLRSLVSSRVEWYLKRQKMLFVYYLYVFLFVCSFLTYVECDGRMSGVVSCVEWLDFLLSSTSGLLNIYPLYISTG